MSNPVIIRRKSLADQLLEIAALIALIILWGTAIYHYRSLPDTIPIHFNYKGEADNFGNKQTVWLLPGLGTGLFVLLTLINRIPHQFNYIIKITEGNAAFQYALAQRLLRYLKLIIICLFTFILRMMIWQTQGKDSSMNAWFLPIFLALILIPIVVYMYLSKKA
jgi:uncharacterized membrane protein